MKISSLSLETLRHLAARCGIEVMGLCDLSRLVPERTRLKLWQDEGHAGDMTYMKRAPELLTETEHLLPGARSVLICTLKYSQAPHPELPAGYGRVARYAWGRDYHRVLPDLLRTLVRETEQHLGRTITYRVFSDALPFLERAGARSAGLGFVGKNTMLIKKGSGSFFFIGEIIWNVEVEQPIPAIPQENSCGTCQRCIDNCPTGAFIEPFVLHAPRCISYLTIEKRGAHTEEEQRAVGEWIFGCDVCQDVCPFNHTTLKNPGHPDADDFSATRGSGPLLSLSGILSIASNREYQQRFADTPLLRTGKAGLQRNALAVAANTGCESLIPRALELATESPNPTLRQSALAMLSRLREADRTAFISAHNALLSDPDQNVRTAAEQTMP